MVRKTTVKVQTDTRDSVKAFKDAAGLASADEAVRELLRIAADEGYWDGDADATNLASAERVDELAERVEKHGEAVQRLHKRLQALEDD